MDKISKLLISIILLIGLVHCNGKNELPNQKDNETNIEQDDTTNANNQSIETEKIEQLIKPEIIGNYLPESLPGFNKLPPSFGAVYEEEYSFTSASSDYVHTNKFSGFTIYIEDYGNEKSIISKEDIDNPQLEPGFTVKKISGANYRGYISMNQTTKSGSLFALLANRFIIRISAEKLTKESPELEDLLHTIKLNDLINQARQKD